MRINVGSRFDHEFADNQENTKFCDTNHPGYDHDLCLDFQGHQTLRINKFIIHKNYKFGLRKDSGKIWLRASKTKYQFDSFSMQSI